jgi:GNAT superfamily N-acetyltransferase
MTSIVLERLYFETNPENILWQFCQTAQEQERALPPEQRFKSSGGIGTQVRLYKFWSKPIIGAWLGNTLIGLDVRTLNKLKWPIWGRYLKNYVVYVLPEFRRGGTARTIYSLVKQQAYEQGCNRLFTRAQSFYGAVFHYSMGHQFWGQASNGEFLIDTPLDDRPYPIIPPDPLLEFNVPLWPMTKQDIAAALLLPPFSAEPDRVEKWLRSE